METEMSDAHISDRLRLDTLADVKTFVDLVIQAIFFRHNADKIGHVGEIVGGVYDGDAMPLADRFELYRAAQRAHGEPFVEYWDAVRVLQRTHLFRDRTCCFVRARAMCSPCTAVFLKLCLCLFTVARPVLAPSHPRQQVHQQVDD